MEFNYQKSTEGLYVPETERDACGVGFVVNLSGKPEHRILNQALELLTNLEHRGGSCGNEKTGDGAGILLQIPDLFLRKELKSKENINLPAIAYYGTGLIFLPKDPNLILEIKKIISSVISSESQKLICFRKLPVNRNALSTISRETEPEMEQIFIERNLQLSTQADFERKLYVIRSCIENEIARAFPEEDFYIPSLSSKTIVYKGLLLAPEISKYFLDLQNPNFETALALVHQRYSTNTFPSWKLAHPFRFICHNGEINTLKANVNSLRAKESLLQSKLFGKDLKKVLPLNLNGLSDSATLDKVLELLHHGGRSLAEVISMMVPEAWEKNYEMNSKRRAYYEYNSCLMEAWDGPALVALTDGDIIAATLDRNGFRPARYTVTKDGQIILASETGATEIASENILYRSRIEPGKMLLIDTKEGRIIPDEEIKLELADKNPYEFWLDENLIPLKSLGKRKSNHENSTFNPETDLNKLLKIFGYCQDDIQYLLLPMAITAEEPMGSMGSDIPLAVLSDKHVLLYDYFKQLFAQVTNPPLDAIREEIVTSSYSLIGGQLNIFETSKEHCRKIRLDYPILTSSELALLKNIESNDFKAKNISMFFNLSDKNLEQALAEICRQSEDAVRSGNNIIILTDHGVSETLTPIPALLACSSVWQHLTKKSLMGKCSLIIDTAEAREVHHIATLLAYGASAVCPYLALEVVSIFSSSEKNIKNITPDLATENYIKSLVKGVIKVMSKMGISTVQSYIGSQLFEIVGLNNSVTEKYFSGTTSRISGIDLEGVTEEILKRFNNAFTNIIELDVSGHYFWRRNGERHLNNPQTIAKLQHAVRSKDVNTFKEYSQLIDDQNKKLYTLRGLFEFSEKGQRIDIKEVEQAKEIVKRFKTGAMSFGSISFEAHANLAIAMNRIGGKSNSGEGGEDARRYQNYSPEENNFQDLFEQSPWLKENLKAGDSLSSGIKQVASGRFGVTSHYLANATEIQIKIAQGAKPGEGGQLPGHKIDTWIAEVRHSTPGVTLISPPPHHDIYSIEDLSQLIYDLKNANPDARISVKLVSEVGVGTIAAGVAKAKADVILISGSDGGTGASPLSSLKYAGLPWELGLSEAHQVLVRNGLRDRIILETDGQLKTGKDVAIASLLGAEEFGFSTAPLIASGCVMMRKCHLNTCPVGIATQDPELRKKFEGKPEHVIDFMFFVAEEVREILALLGFKSLDEMCGRVDKLDYRPALAHWKASGLDFSRILYQHPTNAFSAKQKIKQDHKLEDTLDSRILLPLAKSALEEGKRIFKELKIRNINRSVGAILGAKISKLHGAQGLAEDSIHFKFHGSAGQSFAAFAPKGLTMEIEGDANDYFGKGLSGGKLAIYPSKKSTFIAEENVIIGNVAFYGATSGNAFVRGRAGERFCVRNSGVEVVVEGIGDHGCEYMTGGKVIILGATGRNFAAGMSGGIAYLYCPTKNFKITNLASNSLEISAIENIEEKEYIKQMLKTHAIYTESTVAKVILADWENSIKHFQLVIPLEYKRAIENQSIKLSSSFVQRA